MWSEYRFGRGDAIVANLWLSLAAFRFVSPNSNLVLFSFSLVRNLVLLLDQSSVHPEIKIF